MFDWECCTAEWRNMYADRYLCVRSMLHIYIQVIELDWNSSLLQIIEVFLNQCPEYCHQIFTETIWEHKLSTSIGFVDFGYDILYVIYVYQFQFFIKRSLFGGWQGYLKQWRNQITLICQLAMSTVSHVTLKTTQCIDFKLAIAEQLNLKTKKIGLRALLPQNS